MSGITAVDPELYANGRGESRGADICTTDAGEPAVYSV
jgi:hypothetical protein